MSGRTFDLHDPDQFTEAWTYAAKSAGAVIISDLYCPPCGARRTVDFTNIPMHPGFGDQGPIAAAIRCRQCHAIAHAIRYNGPSGKDLVLLRNRQAGLTTPHTPESVAFYLDQAARSEAMSARSAATAMYRAALEQLLHEQGFTSGMLDAKIKALEAAMAAAKAPPWASKLDSEFLKVLKALGNGAIHANGGDVKKQAALDDGLIAAVRATFGELLEIVYEEPARSAARLATLKNAAALVSKP